MFSSLSLSLCVCVCVCVCVVFVYVHVCVRLQKSQHACMLPACAQKLIARHRQANLHVDMQSTNTCSKETEFFALLVPSVHEGVMLSAAPNSA